MAYVTALSLRRGVRQTRDWCFATDGYRCGPRYSNRLLFISSFRISHSQIMRTSQPASFKLRMFSRSTSMVRENFRSQNDLRVFGIDVPRRHVWRCQKQPFTKTTFRRLEKTISGFPGSDRPWTVYRYPASKSIFRTVTSGLVSVALIRPMFHDLLRGPR